MSRGDAQAWMIDSNVPPSAIPMAGREYQAALSSPLLFANVYFFLRYFYSQTQGGTRVPEPPSDLQECICLFLLLYLEATRQEEPLQAYSQ